MGILSGGILASAIFERGLLGEILVLEQRDRNLNYF
jgi:hypothetical protein